MKNLIQLPTSNQFEEKSKEFHQSKLAQRLREKFEPKPFEESYKPVYWISLVTSYLCNLFSILTASTFVFTYFFSILSELPFPILWATLFTGIILVLIEILQRILAPKLFKDSLQYGFKASSLILVTIIVTLSFLSITFSFNGGFDVVDKLSTPPEYVAPLVNDIAAIKAEYRTLIEEASNDANAFKKAKEWLGRLSDKNAKTYKELLDNKATLQSQMIAKTNESEALNRQMTEEAKGSYQSALTSHKNSTVSKGGGLAKFTIIAQLIFFLSIFFIEYFDYKTASQYAILVDAIKPNKTIIQTNQIPVLTANENGIENIEGTSVLRNQIGFRTGRGKQEKSELKQRVIEKTNTVFVSDKHTIEHNGKRYTMKDVNNFINIYKGRVEDALNKGKEGLATNRRKTLKYWKERKKELLNKHQIEDYGQ